MIVRVNIYIKKIKYKTTYTKKNTYKTNLTIHLTYILTELNTKNRFYQIAN